MRKFNRMIWVILLVFFMFGTLAYGKIKTKDIVGTWLIDRDDGAGFVLTEGGWDIKKVNNEVQSFFIHAENGHYRKMEEFNSKVKILGDQYHLVIDFPDIKADFYLELDKDKKGLHGKYKFEGEVYDIHLKKINLQDYKPAILIDLEEVIGVWIIDTINFENNSKGAEVGTYTSKNGYQYVMVENDIPNNNVNDGVIIKKDSYDFYTYWGSVDDDGIFVAYEENDSYITTTLDGKIIWRDMDDDNWGLVFYLKLEEGKKGLNGYGRTYSGIEIPVHFVKQNDIKVIYD